MTILGLGEHKPIMTFGFVPLANFLFPNTSIDNVLSLECPISQHMDVRNCGCLNFMGSRFPVQSELNISAWEDILASLN